MIHRSPWLALNGLFYQACCSRLAPQRGRERERDEKSIHAPLSPPPWLAENEETLEGTPGPDLRGTLHNVEEEKVSRLRQLPRLP